MVTAFISWWAAGRVCLMICQKRGAGYGRRERDGNSELIVLGGSGVLLQCEDGLWERDKGSRKRWDQRRKRHGWWRRSEAYERKRSEKGKRMVDGDRRRPSASSAQSAINEEWNTIRFPTELFPLQAQGSSSTNSHGICWDLLQTSTLIIYDEAKEMHVWDVTGSEPAYQPVWARMSLIRWRWVGGDGLDPHLLLTSGGVSAPQPR